MKKFLCTLLIILLLTFTCGSSKSDDATDDDSNIENLPSLTEPDVTPGLLPDPDVE